MASDRDVSQTEGEATFEINLSSGQVVGQNRKDSGEVIVQKIYNLLTEPRAEILNQLTQELATCYWQSYW
jgi:hypothetical protein